MISVGAALCTLALAGCATTPEQPRVSTITNTVRVPVPTPCIDGSDIPTIPKPTPIDARSATLKQKAAAIAADLQAMDDYSVVADALLRQCAKVAP